MGATTQNPFLDPAPHGFQHAVRRHQEQGGDTGTTGLNKQVGVSEIRCLRRPIALWLNWWWCWWWWVAHTSVEAMEQSCQSANRK